MKTMFAATFAGAMLLASTAFAAPFLQASSTESQWATDTTMAYYVIYHNQFFSRAATVATSIRDSPFAPRVYGATEPPPWPAHIPAERPALPWPALDPMSLPINKPVLTPQPIPFHVLPGVGASPDAPAAVLSGGTAR